MIVSRDAKNKLGVSQYVRTTLTYGVLELSPLYCGCRFISNACSRLYFSHFFGFFVENHLLANTNWVSQANGWRVTGPAGLIFLIIFGFFVENHLLANTKSSFYDLQFWVIIFAGNRPYFSYYFRIQFPWLTVWELWSLQATGLLIIFSFFVEKHKIQFPQLMVLEFYVWFTVVELSPTAGLTSVSLDKITSLMP